MTGVQTCALPISRGGARVSTYKNFKDGDVEEYDGSGGAVKFIQWLDR